MKINEKIKRDADQRGLTTAQIGEKYGKKQQTISNYFNGTNAMPLDFLIWYIHQHPDIDLYALFDKDKYDIVADRTSNYPIKASKAEILSKIGKILDDYMSPGHNPDTSKL